MLKTACMRVLEIDAFSDEQVRKRVSLIEAAPNELVFYLSDGSTRTVGLDEKGAMRPCRA